MKIWETAFKLQIGISVLKEHKSTAVTLVAIEKQFMACVSSEAFVEITTRLRKTGELSDGRIVLDDGSVFKIH